MDPEPVRDDPRLRLPLMLIAALLLQTSVLVRLRVFGVMPDFMLLVAVAAGLTAGPSRGAALGFTAGMVIDLFLPPSGCPPSSSPWSATAWAWPPRASCARPGTYRC